MGHSHCRFDECSVPDQQMGSRDLTDGTWVWPEGLAHYVEAHEVSLPEAFVEHSVRQAGSGLPERSVDPSRELDGSAWLEWCARQTMAPRPDPDAASSDDLASLVERVQTSVFGVRFEPRFGRWRVSFEGSREALDFLPEWSLERIESYVMLRRQVPHNDLLSAKEAQRLCDASCEPRSMLTRLSTALRPWTGSHPIIRQNEPAGLPGSASDAGDGSHWQVRCGSQSGWRPAEDELGLRYWLRAFATEGGSFLDARERRHRRLIAAA